MDKECTAFETGASQAPMVHELERTLSRRAALEEVRVTLGAAPRLDWLLR